jgi:hypothetical protein
VRSTAITAAESTAYAAFPATRSVVSDGRPGNPAILNSASQAIA